MSRSIHFNEELNGTIAHKLKHICGLIDKVIARHYEQYSLTILQADIIMRVYEEERLSVNFLCEELGMSKSNISPVTKKLEVMGYIVKTRDFYDQRVVYLELTDEGRELVRKTNAEIRKAGLGLTNLIGSEQLSNLNSALDALETALENSVEE